MLTAKQEHFAQEYVATDDQVAAYRAAYNTADMNKGAVDVEASRLVDNPKITLRINELRDELHRAQNIAANALTAEYVSIGFADITAFLEVNDAGDLHLADLHALDPWTRRHIKKVTRLADGSFTIELKDAHKALEMLARRFREFSTKLEHAHRDEGGHRPEFAAAVRRIPPEQWETSPGKCSTWCRSTSRSGHSSIEPSGRIHWGTRDDE